MSKRLMTLLEPQVENAVNKHAKGEDITYEIGFGIHPQAGPCWFVGVFMPNPAEIGEDLSFLAVLAPPAKVAKAAGADHIDGAIGNAIEQLLDLRSKVLAGGGQQQPPSPGNGGPVPPPTLLRP